MLTKMKILSIFEPLGGLAMVFGFLTQFAAVGLAIIMIGAADAKIRGWHKKFSEPGGWELDFIIFIANIALLILGAGAISLDRFIFGL